MPLLRDNLEPTDFADADCRVTEWIPFEGYNGINAYRIWLCKCTHHWFQRHEWRVEGKNQTDMGEWLYNGMDRHRTHRPEDLPAPDMRQL